MNKILTVYTYSLFTVFKHAVFLLRPATQESHTCTMPWHLLLLIAMIYLHQLQGKVWLPSVQYLRWKQIGANTDKFV